MRLNAVLLKKQLNLEVTRALPRLYTYAEPGVQLSMQSRIAGMKNALDDTK